MGAGPATVTATYKTVYAVTVNGGSSANPAYAAGETVTVTATVLPGHRFNGWTSTDVTFADANMATTTFTMPANAVTVTANFIAEYQLGVNSGTGGGTYAQGDTVPITANAAVAGMVFDKWVITSGSGGTFADVNSQSTTYTMPASNIIMEARYKPLTYSLTVVNGTGSGTYPTNAVAAITANAAPSGRIFDNWELTGSGTIGDVNDASTTFSAVSGTATATAIYKADGSDTTPSRPGIGEPPNQQTTGPALTTPVYKDGIPVLKAAPSAANQLDISKLTVKALFIADKAWTGKQVKSGLGVKLRYYLNDKLVTQTLKQNKDYTLSKPGKNKNIGKGSITVTAKAGSAIKGTKAMTFKIVPKKPTKLKVKAAGKKALKVTFRKVSKSQKVKTYKVMYRIKGTAKWKTKTVKVKLTGKSAKKKGVSVTLKKLRKGKTYQVRVYAYKGSYKGAPTGIKSRKVK
jgi:hypothetical protein